MTERNCENCPKPDCNTYHPERCDWLHPDGPEKAPTERNAYAATGITISAKEDPNGYAKAYYQLIKAAGSTGYIKPGGGRRRKLRAVSRLKFAPVRPPRGAG